MVEETADGAFGIRLGLQDVHGISEAEIRSILAGRADRPFRDVGDLLRRTTVARPVAEALAHAGAFDALPTAPNRRGHLYEAITAEAPREGDQLTLADAPAPAHAFAGLHRRRGRAGRARGPRAGRHPAPRELLRAAPAPTWGSRGRRDLATQAPGRVGDGRRGEGRLADPGGPQRPADHLPVARRRHRARSRSRSSSRSSRRSRGPCSTPTRWRCGGSCAGPA